jgi:hypothetical protein
MIHHPGGRRWFQFSLSSLFWLTLFVATAMLAFREHRERVRLEEELASPGNQLTLILGGGLQVHPNVPEEPSSNEPAIENESDAP